MSVWSVTRDFGVCFGLSGIGLQFGEAHHPACLAPSAVPREPQPKNHRDAKAASQLALGLARIFERF